MSSQCSYNIRLTFILYLTLFSLMDASGKQRICGKMLTDVLASVCVNGFNYRIKRCLEQEYEVPKTSPPDDSWYYRLKDILRKLETELNENNPEIIEIEHTNRKEDTILIRKRKQVEYFGPRGVADECCTNGCVYADILMYCA
ncbi:insulin-like peptide 4 [Cochliomyia hominivorax]